MSSTGHAAVFCLALAIAAPPASFAAPFTVVSNAVAGPGTLRAAIAAANAAPGLDTISFALPEEECSAQGVCRIELATNLQIFDPVVIDGTTQPRFGSAPENVCATESAPSYMRVEILAPDVAFQGGIELHWTGNAGTSTFRGLALGGGWPLDIQLAGAHRIQCNHLGVDATGTSVLPTRNISVVVEYLADGAIIGTDGDRADDLAERNVGAGGEVVYVNQNANVRIAGNYFGLAADGVSPLPCGTGVYVRQSSKRTRVGSNFDGRSDELERNVFGACQYGYTTQSAVVASGDENVVAGNWFGLDATGDPEPTLYGAGVLIYARGADTILRYNRIENMPVGVLVQDYAGAAGLAPGSVGNCLAGNTVGLRHGGDAALRFDHNWWGAADGPSGLFAGSGDAIEVTGDGFLDVTPWETEGCPAPEPAAALAGGATIAILALRDRRRRPSRSHVARAGTAGRIVS